LKEEKQKEEKPKEDKSKEEKQKEEKSKEDKSKEEKIKEEKVTATPTQTEKSSSTPTSKEKDGPKLNPNAKVFKPMSASAPTFTPSPPVATVPIIPAGQETYMYGRQFEDPYMYGPRGAPVFSVPYVGGPQGMPVQGMYPQQVRMVPGAPPGTPYVYPNGQQYPYSQPVVYQPAQPGGGPQGKVPHANTTPSGSPQQQAHYSPYIQGGRSVMPAFYQPFVPGQPIHPQALDPSFQRLPAQYPPGEPKEGKSKEETPKFQGVPNADNFHATPSTTQKEEKKSKD